MSLPVNLFVDAPELEDVSMHQLSSDTESWPEEILAKLSERVPRASTMRPMVAFKKKDDENGTATGSITVNTADKAAVIPLIIKDFMMYPLDIFIAKSKLLPLTPDYFDAAFGTSEIFDKIEEYPTFGGLGRFEDANLWNAIYPPSLGRYAYASAGYPVMDAISSTIDGAELKKWLTAPSNAKYAARLLAGPHAELIKKVAHLQPVNMNEFKRGVERLIPRSLVVLRYDGPDKYSILSNSDTVFHPGIMHSNRQECVDYLRSSELSAHPEDDVNDVDATGEKLLLLPTPKNDVILAKEDQELVERATEYGHFMVKAKTGVAFQGVVVPKVIDFDQKSTDLRLFLGRSMSGMQPEIYGVRIKNTHTKLPVSAPHVGQTGTFVFVHEGHALATVPVTIRAVVDDCGTTKLKVSDLMGRPITLVHQQHVGPGELHRIAKMDDHYLVPAMMKWVPMAEMSAVTNSVDDYAVKTAGLRITNWPVTLMRTGQDCYALRGVDKYASALKLDKTHLTWGDAQFILLSLGASQEKLARAQSHLAKYSAAEFHNLRQPPLFAEKVAAAAPLAAKLTKIASALRTNLWKEASAMQSLSKEASYLENSQTVDALLSLNFINPNNVSKYVGKIPALKGAISHLASCLLASRLGMKEIPELSASTGMLKLVEVVDGLEKLKATTEIAAQQG